MPYQPLPLFGTASLADLAAHADAQPLPPVERWHPPVCGDSHMVIKRDGTWCHDGAPIARPAMVRAFARLLWRDDAGQHWLVTPQEKLSITVEDAAFVGVDLARKGDALVLALGSEEALVIGPDHPLVVRGTLDAPAAYVAVRHGCEARLNRSTWGQLVDISLEKLWADGAPMVESCGQRFALTPQASA